MLRAPFIRFFCFRTALFFLPVIAVFIFPFCVLWESGEMTPLPRIVDEQQHSRQTVIVGLAYSNPAKYIKIHSFIARHPDIAVFGSSHVMPFRQEFFGDRRFYNAAVGGARLPDFKDFVDQMPVGLEPKVLIVGLDPFFAQPDFEWSQRESDRFDQKAGPLNFLRILGSSWKNVYRDYFHRKFFLRQLASAGKGQGIRIGLEAMAHGNGFARDGSYVNTQKPGVFSGTVKEYGYLRNGESFNERGLPYLESFLETCQRRGICVIGILPPVRSAVYEQLLVSGYRYWAELPQRLGPLFQRRGFSLYDFSRPQSFGGNDMEFYNDFHGSEDAYRRIASKLLSSEKALSR